MILVEAEALGRQAVELRFPFYEGLAVTDFDHYSHRVIAGSRNPWDWDWDYPDFRDRLTSLACIPWVQSVWPKCTVEVTQWPDGTARVQIWDEVTFGSLWSSETDESLPHACIAAVRAAKKGEG